MKPFKRDFCIRDIQVATRSKMPDFLDVESIFMPPFPETREFKLHLILSKSLVEDPDFSLEGYLLSLAPDVYQELLKT